MQDVASQIKQNLNIFDVISGYVNLTKAGNSYKGLSPFRKEKTPSFFVNEQIQIYKDFSTGKGGDLISFIMEVEGLDFKEAIKFIVQKYQLNIDISSLSYTDTNKSSKTLEINNLATDKYHLYLLKSPKAKKCLDYLLVKRKLSIETIKKFKLGCSPDSWDTLYNFLKSEGFSDSDIIESNMCMKGKNGKIFDFYRNRLIIPLFDQYDNVIGFSGRKLNDSDYGPKYINSRDSDYYKKSKYLYGLNFAKSSIKQIDLVYLVEGYFDMISPFQNGIENLAVSGGTALTEDQLLLLKRYTKNIVLLLDNDLAGQEAILRGIELYQKHDINLSVVVLSSEFKDPDEAASNDIQSFKKSLNNKISFWDFFFYYVSKKYNLTDITSKKDAADFLSSQYKLVDNEIIKREFVKKFSDLFEIDEIVSLKMLEDKLPSKKIVATFTNSTEKDKLTSAPFDESEVYFLRLLLNSTNLDDYKGIEFTKFITDSRLAQISKLLENNINSDIALDLKQLTDKISDSALTSLLKNLSLGLSLENKYIATEASKALKRLQTKYYNSLLNDLKKQLAISEKTSNFEDQARILKEIEKVKLLLI